MKVNGNKIKQEIHDELQERLEDIDQALRLDLFYVGDSQVTENFMRLKKEFGESIGVQVVMHTFAHEVNTDQFTRSLRTVVGSDAVDGVVVQLPLPERFPTQDVLDVVSTDKDTDMLATESREQFSTGDSLILPPVVGAIKEVCNRYEVNLGSAEVAVVGAGRLVGQPTAVWLENNFGAPTVYEKGDDLAGLQSADVIISGAGDSHIIQPEHIQPGVVLIDAGTSQSEGGTKGDIDPACADKAQLSSPVPGGIGPITVAKLFQNLVALSIESS